MATEIIVFDESGREFNMDDQVSAFNTPSGVNTAPLETTPSEIGVTSDVSLPQDENPVEVVEETRADEEIDSEANTIDTVNPVLDENPKDEIDFDQLAHTDEIVAAVNDIENPNEETINQAVDAIVEKPVQDIDKAEAIADLLVSLDESAKLAILRRLRKTNQSQLAQRVVAILAAKK